MENITITAKNGRNCEFKFFCSKEKMSFVLIKLLEAFRDIVAIDNFTGEVEFSYYATKGLFKPDNRIEIVIEDVMEILEKED